MTEKSEISKYIDEIKQSDKPRRTGEKSNNVELYMCRDVNERPSQMRGQSPMCIIRKVEGKRWRKKKESWY